MLGDVRDLAALAPGCQRDSPVTQTLATTYTLTPKLFIQSRTVSLINLKSLTLSLNPKS